MRGDRKRWAWGGGLLATIGGAIALAWLPDASFGGAAQPKASANRFEFEVVESFDSKYAGDTAGHLGRGGGFQGQIDIALGDPVYRKGERVGTVTRLAWDRTRGSLEVEFKPELRKAKDGTAEVPIRIAVGDDVWIPRGGAAPAGPGG